MDVKFSRSYKSKKGNTVFVYAVTNAKDAAAFKAASGDFYREDEKTGQALWFTTRYIGERGSLIVTDAGKIYPDLSAFEKAQSLAKQYGGDFGNELARAAVANLMSGANSTGSQPATKPVEQAPATEQGVDPADM